MNVQQLLFTSVTRACQYCRGGKGQGKSFQTELAMKKLGIEPVIMSAGVWPPHARPQFVRRQCHQCHAISAPLHAFFGRGFTGWRDPLWLLSILNMHQY